MRKGTRVTQLIKFEKNVDKNRHFVCDKPELSNLTRKKGVGIGYASHLRHATYGLRSQINQLRLTESSRDLLVSAKKFLGYNTPHLLKAIYE